MSAEKIHAQHEDRAAEWFGLRPSTARECPRVVARKRCLDHRAPDGDPCICQRHRRILDHARIWIDRDGHHVLTGEPYEADARDLAALLTDVSALGLAVHLFGRSPWNPGFTFLIRITAPKGSR